jgi:hypothetical protein
MDEYATTAVLFDDMRAQNPISAEFVELPAISPAIV